MSLLALMLVFGGSDGTLDDLVRASQVEELAPHAFARARGGVWGSGGFGFTAIQLDGERHIDGRSLNLVGGDVGIELFGQYVFFAGYDHAWAGDVTLSAWSAGMGFVFDVPEFTRNMPPFHATFYAAAMHGSFDVDTERFAGFDDGWGIRAGLQLSFPVWGAVSLGLFAEGRFLRFEYQETVLDGDRFAGGGGFAGGGSLELRF